MKHQICVVGTGYVGMASAIGLATIGHQVHGYDIMAERVRSLSKGHYPIPRSRNQRTAATEI